VNVDMEKLKNDATSLNPELKIFEVSCTTGEGLHRWTEWLSGLK